MTKLIIRQIYFLITSSFIIILLHSIPSHYKDIHPLILISILFTILCIARFIIRIFLNNHIISFLIFLIIIGGIIVIFIYFIRFINNITTSIKFKIIKIIPLKITRIIFLIFYQFNRFQNLNWKYKFNETETFKKSIFLNNNLEIFYLFPKNYSTILSILYLLICLTLIVKICLIKKKTLRKINYEKIIYKKP